MFPKVSDILAPLLGIAAVLLAIGLTVQTLRVSSLKVDLAREQADRAKETAERERVAREATARIAALQAQHAAEQQRLSDDFAKDRDALVAAAAAATADADGLRAAIDDFAAARSVDPSTRPAAGVDPGDRAAVLGSLFREADSLAESLARAAERHAAEVRALKAQIKADRLACEGAR